MAGQFKKEVIIQEDYYDGGAIVLRRPKAAEINIFTQMAYPTSRKGFLKEDRDPCSARVDYFDRLFLRIEGFIGEDGEPLPEDAVEHIPEDEKNHVIITHIEAREGLEGKN